MTDPTEGTPEEGPGIPSASPASGGGVEVPESEEQEQPVGTLFVMMIFLIVLAGMWGAIYLLYLSR